MAINSEGWSTLCIDYGAQSFLVSRSKALMGATIGRDIITLDLSTSYQDYM